MKTLIVYHQGHQQKILPPIKIILKEKKIDFAVTKRELLKESHYKNKNLIIVIGGDGTFLRTAYLNKNIPMLGINPKPRDKEGFFMRANTLNFKKKLKNIFDGKLKIIKLLRLEAKINSKKIKGYILNEIFLGDHHSYNMFNYHLAIGDKKEFQRSSGLIVGTPAGSHGWIKSAGGKTMNMAENKFQFIARELYCRKLNKKCKLKKGVLKKEQIIKIICRSPGILAIDALTPPHKINRQDKIEIYASKNYLPYIKV